MIQTTRVGFFSILLFGAIFSATEAHAQYEPTAAASRPLYRYFRSGTQQEHFFTWNFAEMGCGGSYAYEGVLGYLQKNLEGGTTALIRFYNPTIDRHYYSIGSAPSGYVSEGPVGYIYTSAAPNTTALYQAYSSTAKDLLLTTSASEYFSFPPNTYTPLGIAGYIYVPPPQAGQACVTTTTIIEPSVDQIVEMNGADYTQATVVFQGQVPGALADWTLDSTYTTADGTFGPYTTHSVGSTVYDYRDSVTYDSAGGKVTVKPTCDSCTNTSIDVYVVGPSGNVPEPSITAYATSLYGAYSPPTPALMTGIAMQESDYRQFETQTIYGKTAKWPLPSYRGSHHSGLMMVEPARFGPAILWNWKTNVWQGLNFWNTEKRSIALSVENSIRASTNNVLRSLHDDERENMITTLYGEGAEAGNYGQYYRADCTGTIQGKNCNGGAWRWVINDTPYPPGASKTNPDGAAVKGVKYTNDVRTKCKPAGSCPPVPAP